MKYFSTSTTGFMISFFLLLFTYTLRAQTGKPAYQSIRESADERARQAAASKEYQKSQEAWNKQNAKTNTNNNSTTTKPASETDAERKQRLFVEARDKSRLAEEKEVKKKSDRWDKVIKELFHGLKAVKSDGKWGFVDSWNRMVIPQIYDDVSTGNDQYISVSQNEEWGKIDVNGEEIIPIDYDSPFEFRNGLAVVEYLGRYGFIDESNKVVIPFIYDEIANNFWNGIAPVRTGAKWGFINEVGKIIVVPKYDEINVLSPSMAAVRIKNKWGCVNSKGTLVIPLKYDRFGEYYGKIGAIINGQTEYFDQSGKKLPVEPKQEVAILNKPIPSKEKAAVDTGAAKKPVTKSENTKTNAVISSDDQKSILNTLTKIVQYNDSVKAADKNKPVSVSIESKIKSNTIYDETKPFSEGLAVVRKQNKYGVIDSVGNIIVPVVYDSVIAFRNGMASVQLNGKWGLMDKTGELKGQLKYDEVYVFYDSELVGVKLGEKWGCINRAGIEVVPLIYDYVVTQSPGIMLGSRFRKKKDYFDNTGKPVNH